MGGKDNLQFCDLPVRPLQINQNERAKLDSSVSTGDGEKPLSIRVLPEKYTAPPGYELAEMLSARESSQDVSISGSEVGSEADHTSVGVEGDDGPHLRLTATLTALMENSDPVRVRGMIFGTFKGMKRKL